jgi:ferredoxin--NADP+ reductase
MRESQYNAVVTSLRLAHEDLMILRIRPDAGVPDFEPGQYVTLGLGNWERRIDSLEATSGPGHEQPRLIRRAYSVSCPLIDDDGRLLPCADCEFLEVYIALVRKPTDSPPPLTPRLFALAPGDRLYTGPRPHGRYTLEGIGANDDVLLLATGTGEAPHNAMAAELLARGHRARIALVTCARFSRDLAYLDAHRRLEAQFPNYRYISLTTREPENVNPRHPHFVGKHHLQDWFAAGLAERALGWMPRPEFGHIFLCGNPAMIGLPGHDEAGHTIYPEPPGMVEFLDHHGFYLGEPGRPGNLHVERYW